MLKIFYNLEPFFEDAYRELSVREYGRLRKISPPTASKILKSLAKGNLLISKKQGIYLVFRANNECHLFKDLAVAYWREKLFHLLEGIHKEVLFKSVILFGSIAKDADSLQGFVKKRKFTEKQKKRHKNKVKWTGKNALKEGWQKRYMPI